MRLLYGLSLLSLPFCDPYIFNIPLLENRKMFGKADGVSFTAAQKTAGSHR